MIMFGKEEYVPQLKLLWKEVFGDSEEYVDAFFKEIYQDENVLLFADGKDVLAALYMVPYEHDFSQKNAKLSAASQRTGRAIYLYALATQKSARNKGIMGEMITKSQKIARERGCDYLFLIPSEDKIINFYERFGFERTVGFTKGMLSAKELNHEKNYYLICRRRTDGNGENRKIPMMINQITDCMEIDEIFIEKVLM